jgi:hypothetical protein
VEMVRKLRVPYEVENFLGGRTLPQRVVRWLVGWLVGWLVS